MYLLLVGARSGSKQKRMYQNSTAKNILKMEKQQIIKGI